MQPHQFSYPEQEQIHNRLNTLVGPGAAVFYKDACRLMTMNTPLESTTHLVGHLLREVESSLRAVLKPILDQTTNKKGSGDENHRNEILAALKTLGISETSPVAEIWLKLPGKENEYGLHKRAHREDLAPPRVIDEEFEGFWGRIHILLDTVLDQFEARAAEIRIKLDELLAKSIPTEKDIKSLRLNIPNSAFALGYFFERLESLAWLKPLKESGFFNNPPDIENDAESKTYRFPVWAQSHYLIKAAPYEPELVLEIAIQLMDTGSDNILIYEDLAEAALKMPPELAARWVKKAIEWLKQQPYLHQYIRLPDNLGKLLTYLTSGNQADTALELTRELLVILPQVSDSSSYREPIIRFNEYHYGRIIKEYMSVLTEQQPHEVLNLLCDLLDRYLSLSHSIREDPISEDHSHLWSPTLDSTSWNQHGINSLLAGSIWDIAKQILEQAPNQAKNLCQKFQSYHWRIFDRILLYVMLHFPEQSQALIIERLLDRDRINNTSAKINEG